MNRQRTWSLLKKPLGILGRAQRKRKSYSFERLEDRLAFSVAPGTDTSAVSDTALAAAQEAFAREMQWALMQAVDAATPAQYTTYSLPNDPLFPNQWHLLNIGQEVGNPDLQDLFGVAGEDINVAPVWNMGYTGEGILVAVLDSGVELFHPDLTGNIHPTLRFNALTGTSNASPNYFDPSGFHGTAVAGLIAAVWNNEEGGTGVAPNATLVPIRLGLGPFEPLSFDQFAIAFQYVVQNDIDITNNSWGPNHESNRSATPLTPEELEILRNSAIFGRDGLGIIHVFASGNDAGPAFHTGWNPVGNYDSSSYNPWVNSRYTIGVTGVDHDGLYVNEDGTFTSYPTAGPSVLVAAPTGSSGRLTIADDDGFGSGIWTTDLVGDFGVNAAPLPNGFDPDNDFLPDPNYTSRFTGTSAAAPLVSGVIALMLEANPNLTYRDVQNILVRSSRQNAQFETPSSGGVAGGLALKDPLNTWQTNQIGPFRGPDLYDPMNPIWLGSFTAVFDPIADPSSEGLLFGGLQFAPDTGDGGRQFLSHYEPQPGMFTNGAGFTVSQGYGIYGEQIGYAHGVIDAELAVQMALQWDTLGQDIDRLTEKTFTTSIISPGQGFFWNIPAAEKTTGPPDGPSLIVPGGIFGRSGYIAWWNEYFVDMPFANYTGPHHSQRGDSYVDFAVPADQSIDVEWVEVKLEMSGNPDDFDFLRIMLTSPEGTQSELSNYYLDPEVAAGTFSLQDLASPPDLNNPIGAIPTSEGNFVWTFSTNRHWGESSNSVPLLHPVTGEPLLDSTGSPIFRNWELHFENWSNTSFEVLGMEVVWHGKPIENGALDQNYGANGIAKAQRIQGFVGIDSNSDEQFNYNRYVQTLFGSHSDVETIRSTDVTRQLDFNDNNFNDIYDLGDTINQESFAENILVEAYRVDPVTGEVDVEATARFLTGADGNYFFDLDPTLEYEIRITDPLNRIALNDVTTPASAPAGLEYLPHFQQSWRITPDWFYAPDRDNALLLENEPGEILFDPLTNAPVPFTDGALIAPVPMAVKNVNFLLKQDAPVNEFLVEGTVYADLNGDGAFNGDDVPAPGIFVFWDANRNGEHDSGENQVQTDVNGQYTLTIPATAMGTFAIGVIPPTDDWIPTDSGGDGIEEVFAGPGSPTQTVNFFLDPPNDAFPPGGINEPGNLIGVVFNDLDEDGVRDTGEPGLANIRVFIDANENGSWDSGTETSVITTSNGSYIFADVAPNELYRIDVHIENEGTANAAWRMTQPLAGFREVQVGPGGTVTGIRFGLENRADRDWGDLPESYHTSGSSVPVGPSHFVVPGFRLGNSIDGEVNGIPSAAANSDDLVGDTDDGVVVVSNGGLLQPGINVLRVTVFGVGGLLTGWIDWNKNGQFEEATERIQWRDASGNLLGSEADINQGTFDLQVIAPADAVSGALAARFRWGEAGLGFTGPAQVGEVEDYFFSLVAMQVSGLAGDYNNDSAVNNADFVVWRRFNGTNTLLPNDTTPGAVTQEDYDVWRSHFGMTAPGGGSGSGGSQSIAAATQVPTPATSVEISGQSASSSGYGAALDSLASSPQSSAAVASTDAVGPVFSLARAFEVIRVDAGSSTSNRSEPSSTLFDQAAVETSDAANLLLLDQAWAELEDSADEAPFRDLNGDDEAGDLALATVFADESNWWSM